MAGITRKFIAIECSASMAKPRLIAALLSAISLLAFAWQPAAALTMEQARENCRTTVGRPIVQACMGGTEGAGTGA